MSKPSVHTLALLGSAELRADKTELVCLQRGVVDQLRAMRRLRGEEALRGLLVGMTLIRIKASMPYGTFEAWATANVAQFGIRYARYLMRLAMEFVERAKVAKPELLALPGDQTELAIESTEGVQRRFLEKAVKFVGDLSLNELLIKYNIKAVGLKTELEKANDDTSKPEAPEDYFATVAERIDGFRSIVTSRESLQRLSTQQLETLHQTVTDTYQKFRRLYAEAKGAIQI